MTAALTTTTIFVYILYLNTENARANAPGACTLQQNHLVYRTNMKLGIISALHEEQEGLVEALEGPHKLTHGMRDY